MGGNSATVSAMVLHRRPVKTYILKLDKDDPVKELDFTVRCQMRLTTAQRFRQMLSRSTLIAEMMVAHGHTKGPLVIKRT